MLMLRIVTIAGHILQITQNLMIPITRQNITVITAMQKNRKREAYLALRRDFRTISGNPRQFNYRDESAGVCISAQCKQYNNPHPLLKYKYKK